MKKTVRLILTSAMALSLGSGLAQGYDQGITQQQAARVASKLARDFVSHGTLTSCPPQIEALLSGPHRCVKYDMSLAHVMRYTFDGASHPEISAVQDFAWHGRDAQRAYVLANGETPVALTLLPINKDSCWLIVHDLYDDSHPAGLGNHPMAFTRALHPQRPRLQGSDVLVLQERLMRVDGSWTGLAGDGYYGPNTSAAVAVFQAANGLPMTGRVGKDTWARLFSRSARRFPADVRNSLTEAWLAR